MSDSTVSNIVNPAHPARELRITRHENAMINRWRKAIMIMVEYPPYPCSRMSRKGSWDDVSDGNRLNRGVNLKV